MSESVSKLIAAKDAYPFTDWEQSDMEQYSNESCQAFTDIFDRLIANLVDLGKNASKTAKLDVIQKAVLELNDLNEIFNNLIETDEREQLCELINSIAMAAGLDPAEYGDGEGPASEWREW